MAITTIPELEKYLNSKGIPFTNITSLTGGSSNFVWRLTSPTGETSIFKHAEPFLAKKTSIPFSLDRQDFEIRSLTMFPSLLPIDEVIRLPTLLSHDTKAHVLQLEDVGTRTLQDSYTDPYLDIPNVGQLIGGWLARLHLTTTNPEVRHQFKHEVIKKMYRWNFNMLSSVLETYGFDPTLGDRIDAAYGSLIETDDICVCHTDMWPGNILIPDDQSKGLDLVVIDWEGARNGDGVTDVGHFAGEAFFLDHVKGQRGLLNAFLRAYVEAKGVLGVRERERIAAQYGTSVTFWPSIHKWIKEDEKKEIIAYGHRILQKVDEKDWKWFETSDLGPVFTANF